MYKIKNEMKGPLCVELDDKQTLHLAPKEFMIVDESVFKSRQMQRLIKQRFVSFFELKEEKKEQ